MESACEKRSVDHKSARIPEHAPPDENREYADVHRISRNPVWPSGNQMPWWIPGCQRPAPGNVELAHAPQQKNYPETKRRRGKFHVAHREACRDPDRHGHGKRDHAGQSEKSCDGADKHVSRLPDLRAYINRTNIGQTRIRNTNQITKKIAAYQRRTI